MTPQESRLLNDFLSQLAEVRGIRKDPEAEAAIARAVAQQPDAAYLLVQRALLQDQALQNAQAELARLRREMEQNGGREASGSFLDVNNAWGHHAVQMPHPEAQSTVMQSAPARFAAAGAPATAVPRPGMLGTGSGFLGNLAATAAGVAGGAFLFQGIQNLLNPHHPQEAQAQNPAENPAQNHFMDSLGPSDGTDAAPSAPQADDSSPEFGADFADSGDDMDFGGSDDGTSI